MSSISVFSHKTIIVASLTVLLFIPHQTFAQTVRNMLFPVSGEYTYRDDYGEPRGGGTRAHQGIDVIAVKMTPLVAVTDGVVSFVARPEVRWGYEVEIQDTEGYSYSYLHINNDTPGTDDGAGGEGNAYPPGIQHGVSVSRGTVIGWVGDSGNAENTVSHLHFEIRDPNGIHINPYASLVAASGGKGVSAGAPNTNTPDSSDRERLLDLRHVFTKDLSLGMESSDVRQLQRVLKSLGFFSHPSATGYFGNVTLAAVRSYQKQKNLPMTGTVGLLTRRSLNNDLGTYDPNDYVPFYSEADLRAIKIMQIREQIRILEERLRATRGY